MTTTETDVAQLASEQAQKELIEKLNSDPGDVPTTPKKTDAAFSPITAAQMRGDRVPIKVGTLELSVKPLTRKKVREFIALVYEWPDVLQLAAAVPNPSCPGIDYEATAALFTGTGLMLYTQAEEVRAQEAAKNNTKYEAAPKPEPVTALDVADMCARVNDSWELYEAPICDAVWLMAQGTEGIVWPQPMKRQKMDADPQNETEEEKSEPEYEWVEDNLPDGAILLSDLLNEHLTLPNFVDLLRALKAANGGYKGDLSSRFLRSVDGQAEPANA